MSYYIIYPTLGDAIDRSRQEWLRVLGRAKRPEDVTDRLWNVVEHPQNGTGALVVDFDPERLNPQEMLQLQQGNLVTDGFIYDSFIETI